MLTQDLLMLNLSEKEFIDLIDAAFKNYDSLLELYHSPLAGSSLTEGALVLIPPQPDDYGRALRVVLRWATGELAPEPTRYPFNTARPLDDPTWKASGWQFYNILRHYYLEPLSILECPEMEGLKLSRTSALVDLLRLPDDSAFFRLRNRAVREAARIIRIQLTTHKADEELRRIALQEFYEPLKPEYQLVLDLAAIFKGPFARAWILHLAAQEYLEINPALNYLVHQRLLIEKDAGTLLQMPPALQQYVYARQRNSPLLRNRHAMATQFYRDQYAPLQTAWHLKQSGRPQEAAGLLLDQADFLINEFQADELCRALEEFTAAELPLPRWCDVQLRLCDLYRNKGETRQAILTCWQVIRATNSACYQARGFHRLGKLYEDYGPNRALGYYRQAAERLTPEALEWSELLKDRAWLYLKIRQWEPARADLEAALNCVPPTELLQQANIHDALSTLYRNQLNYDAALDHARQALARREESGDLLRIADSCNNIGILYDEMGLLDQAIASYKEALNIAQRLGNPERIANSRLNLGAEYYLMSDYPAAIVQYWESLTLYQQIGMPRGEAQARYNLAEACATLEQWEEAQSHWLAGYTLSQQAGLDDQLSWFNQLKETFPLIVAETAAPPPSPIPSASPAAPQLNSKEQQAIDLAREAGYITTQKLKALGLAPSTVTRVLGELVRQGLLVKAQKGCYYITSAVPPNPEKK